MDLKDIFEKKKIGDKIEVEGWIRNHRPQKEFGFIDFYDGTCLKSLQVVYIHSYYQFCPHAQISE